MVCFINDPIQICVQAFNHLYPKKELYIQYDINLIKTNQEAYLAKSKTEKYVIGVNPTISVADIVMVIREMMTNYIAGSDKRTKKWKTVHDNIGDVMIQITNCYSSNNDHNKLLASAVERNDLN